MTEHSPQDLEAVKAAYELNPITELDPTNALIGKVIPWDELDPFMQKLYMDLDGDLQCREVAGVEYGQMLRCSNQAGHEGEHKP